MRDEEEGGAETRGPANVVDAQDCASMNHWATASRRVEACGREAQSRSLDEVAPLHAAGVVMKLAAKPQSVSTALSTGCSVRGARDSKSARAPLAQKGQGTLELSAREKATRSPSQGPVDAGGHRRDEPRAPVPKHGIINGGRPRAQAGTAWHQGPPRPTRRLWQQPPAQILPARCRSRSPRAPGGRCSRSHRRQTRGRRGRRRRP